MYSKPNISISTCRNMGRHPKFMNAQTISPQLFSKNFVFQHKFQKNSMPYNYNRNFCTEQTPVENKPQKVFSPKIENFVSKLAALSQEEAIILNDVVMKVFGFREFAQGQQSAASGSGGAAGGAETAQQSGGGDKQEEAAPKVEAFNVKIKAISGGVKSKFAIMKLIQTLQPDLSLGDVCFLNSNENLFLTFQSFVIYEI